MKKRTFYYLRHVPNPFTIDNELSEMERNEIHLITEPPGKVVFAIVDAMKVKAGGLLAVSGDFAFWITANGESNEVSIWRVVCSGEYAGGRS
jgi:hypothetical protein